MYQIDRKTVYIIMAILLFLTLYNLATFNLVATLLTLPGVILAMSFHEFAHAFTADKLGDSTPRNQGRLTLDPLKHIDPVGMFLLIFAHMGWGKPVQINPNNFSKMSKEKGEALVALAGPVMNFILAFILMIIFYALIIFVPGTGVLSSLSAINVANVVITILYYAIIVNVGLGVFNLIPIPPLDGSKIFLPILPRNAKTWFINNQQIFYIIFLIIWITGIAGRLISPLIDTMTEGILGLAMRIFGLL